MKKIFFIIFAIMLSLSIVTASAASLDFIYDKGSRSFDMKGTLGTSEHQAVLVYFFDSAIGSSAALGNSQPPTFSEIGVTGANGSFEFSRTFSDTYTSGKYRLIVSSVEDTWTKDFMYVNHATVDTYLSQINGASSAAALQTVLSNNKTDLGIDSAVFEPIKSTIASYLYSIKSGGFPNAAAFINALDQSTAEAQIKNGASVPSVLKEYSKALSIDFENDYNKFSSSVKSAINTELKNASYGGNKLSAQYSKLRAVAFIKSAPTAPALKNAFYGVDDAGNTIVSNYSVIINDPSSQLTVFNSVQNKNSVFDIMFANRVNLTSIENIRSEFSKAALSVYTSEQEGGYVEEGGGGFGGSVPSGPVTIDPGYQNPAEPPKSHLFNDVAYADWFYPSVERLVALSLVNGYEDKTYRPLNPITRAEYTKLIIGIASYLKIPLDAGQSVDFTDVYNTDWYYDVVNKAASTGLVTGADGKFNPNDLITRQDAAVIIHRLASKVKAPIGEKIFNDSNKIADYAKTAVSTLAASGIISGMGDNTFAPVNNLTRAEAAKLLSGVLDFLS